MRKLEGQLKAIVDDLGYLKEREERFAKTNCELYFCKADSQLKSREIQRTNEYRALLGSSSCAWLSQVPTKSFIYGASSSENTSSTE